MKAMKPTLMRRGVQPAEVIGMEPSCDQAPANQEGRSGRAASAVPGLAASAPRRDRRAARPTGSSGDLTAGRAALAPDGGDGLRNQYPVPRGVDVQVRKEGGLTANLFGRRLAPTPYSVRPSPRPAGRARWPDCRRSEIGSTAGAIQQGVRAGPVPPGAGSQPAGEHLGPAAPCSPRR